MSHSTQSKEDEWLWGWDPTPGIVSVLARIDGRAWVWRRDRSTRELHLEETRFSPWVLLDTLDDIRELGDHFAHEQDERKAGSVRVRYRELSGPGQLRYLVTANDLRTIGAAILPAASRRLGRPIRRLGDLGQQHILLLSPEEQYLVATGRTYFRDLAFDDLRRLQFDLETTGLDPRRDRIFMVAVRDPEQRTTVIEARGRGDAAEATLIQELAAFIRAADPDVIENHNLHGFDLPFLNARASRLRVPLELGRTKRSGLMSRAARRGMDEGNGSGRRTRYMIPGRELIDTMDAVFRYDFSTRELPSHGLKAVARHFGVAPPDRVEIPGRDVFRVYQSEPERVRRYASADVEEVAAIARLLGGAAFGLARMAPRRYERLADAGAATGVIDPMLVRAYLREGAALPAHREGSGEEHSGAALHLFASGVAFRVVKADVASLYPSLMRAYRIGPERDHLGALLAIVDRLVELRLDAKAKGRAAPPDSAERHLHEATSAAMKLVVNSAYGYLAAGGGLTRFADVHAANEVTRRGREALSLICSELAARGVTLLEADTDGVYFAVPDHWTPVDETRVVSEVAALLPSLVKLELEGRYAAMLSHEPKNYALLGYDGTLTLRGVAFRSSRAEPFGEAFLRRALMSLLVGDVSGVRNAFLECVSALRSRSLDTYSVTSRMRLKKTPAEYLVTRLQRRETQYEAMIAAGREAWSAGERVRVYRASDGNSRIFDDQQPDSRAYDVEHYVRVLRDNFASRMSRALTSEDFAAVFGDPDQLTLFEPSFAQMRPIAQKHYSGLELRSAQGSR